MSRIDSESGFDQVTRMCVNASNHKMRSQIGLWTITALIKVSCEGFSGVVSLSRCARASRGGTVRRCDGEVWSLARPPAENRLLLAAQRGLSCEYDAQDRGRRLESGMDPVKNGCVGLLFFLCLTVLNLEGTSAGPSRVWAHHRPST